MSETKGYIPKKSGADTSTAAAREAGRREAVMKRTGLMGLVFVSVVLFCLGAEAKDWETDFEKASARAKEAGKYMLLDFSGSDWCGWCIKLDKEVFSKNAFQKFAKANLVCVMLDFPRAKPQSNKLKKQNKALAEKYGIRGFPTVLILSPDGDPVERTGYQRGGPEKYVEHLTEIIDKHKAKQPKRSAE